jgi:succinate dehydrogenase / fumarate reductase cytochrome b subunit
MTVTETLRYRGAIGQWSWVLHRISGLGVVLFLTLHVIDTSWAVFYPDLYEKAIAVYQTPLFTIGEFVLVACVVYHAFNGVRIALFDYRPSWWKYQGQAALIVIGLAIMVLLPVFMGMFGHVLAFYNDPDRQTLGLLEVIESQLPFAAGIAIAAAGAVVASAVFGVVGGSSGVGAKIANRGSRIEKFWWSFMRVSGIIIVPLVFGHLAMMHVLQGVFDITAQGYSVVGTSTINQTGTAVEFVGNRWNYLVAGVAIWRLYDFALLVMVVLHGFNGLRYVLTDYTMKSPLLRRASFYLCVIGMAVLLTMGGLALVSTIDSTAVEMAQEAQARLFEGQE